MENPFQNKQEMPLGFRCSSSELIEYRVDFMTQIFSDDGFPAFLDLQLRS